MRRRRLIEIEDQPWCPALIRDALTDYLQAAIRLTRPYAAVLPLLAQALARAETRKIVDLCSGGGGPWGALLPGFQRAGLDLSVYLTDKYPNLPALEQVQQQAPGQVTLVARPVDATAVPAELQGFRTLFTALHHFEPQQVRGMLADAVRRRQGIAAFELTQRSPGTMLIIGLTFFLVLLITPFIRPFRWSRLLLTYLLPVVPLLVVYDGLVSCLRSYTLDELRSFTLELQDAGYEWSIGQLRSKGSPLPITYLIGVPGAASKQAL